MKTTPYYRGLRYRLAIVVGLSWCLLVSHGLAADAPAAKRSVLFFAAASTTDAAESLRAEFERSHADVKVRTSFAASSTLAKQIAAGAGADLFLSANEEWADYLAKQDLVGRRHDLLGNRLVIVVPADSKLRIVGPQDLLDKQITRLALGDVESVPAGIYARQALGKLDLWEKLRGKVVGGADVRQALRFVESSAAEAGIVYETDAAGVKQVRVAAIIDSKLTGPIRYPLVLSRAGTKNEAAIALFDFLTSPAAAVVFKKYGFQVLKPETKKTD